VRLDNCFHLIADELMRGHRASEEILSFDVYCSGILSLLRGSSPSPYQANPCACQCLFRRVFETSAATYVILMARIWVSALKDWTAVLALSLTGFSKFVEGSTQNRIPACASNGRVWWRVKG
jgi:hypothetical protein